MWEVARIDMGSGGNQIRLVPDGTFRVRITKEGAVELIGNSRMPTLKGSLKWDTQRVFSFTPKDRLQRGFNGTWAAESDRLILSFKWQGVPISVLLHVVNK